MSNTEADFGAPLVEKIDGENVEFPRISMKDYQTVENMVKADLNTSVKQKLDDCGLAGPERFKLLIEYAPNYISTAVVHQYLGSFAGAKKVLDMSLTKKGAVREKIDDVLGALDIMVGTNLARALCGLEKHIDLEEVAKGAAERQLKEKEGAEQESPLAGGENPQAGATPS